jgi:hypothetical protein
MLSQRQVFYYESFLRAPCKTYIRQNLAEFHQLSSQRYTMQIRKIFQSVTLEPFPILELLIGLERLYIPRECGIISI